MVIFYITEIVEITQSCLDSFVSLYNETPVRPADTCRIGPYFSACHVYTVFLVLCDLCCAGSP